MKIRYAHESTACVGSKGTSSQADGLKDAHVTTALGLTVTSGLGGELCIWAGTQHCLEGTDWRLDE